MARLTVPGVLLFFMLSSTAQGQARVGPAPPVSDEIRIGRFLLPGSIAALADSGDDDNPGIAQIAPGLARVLNRTQLFAGQDWTVQQAEELLRDYRARGLAGVTSFTTRTVFRFDDDSEEGPAVHFRPFGYIGLIIFQMGSTEVYPSDDLAAVGVRVHESGHSDLISTFHRALHGANDTATLFGDVRTIDPTGIQDIYKIISDSLPDTVNNATKGFLNSLREPFDADLTLLYDRLEQSNEEQTVNEGLDDRQVAIKLGIIASTYVKRGIALFATHRIDNGVLPVTALSQARGRVRDRFAGLSARMTLENLDAILAEVETDGTLRTILGIPE